MQAIQRPLECPTPAEASPGDSAGVSAFTGPGDSSLAMCTPKCFGWSSGFLCQQGWLFDSFRMTLIKLPFVSSLRHTTLRQAQCKLYGRRSGQD